MSGETQSRKRVRREIATIVCGSFANVNATKNQRSNHPKMRTTKEMENQTGFERLRLAIVGQEKAGKSRLAATAPKPVLLRDYDQRRESVAGIPGVFVVTYTDEPLPKQPEGFSEVLDDTTKLEREATIGDFCPDASPEWRDKRPATLVEDSNASLSRLIRANILYSSPKLRRDISFAAKAGQAATTIQTIGSRDFYNSEMPTMENYILRILGLPMHVIMTFHEAAEEANDSTDENPKFTGKITPYPVRHGRLLRYFNEVWRLERTQGKVPTVQLVPDYRFTTATNLLVDKVEKPDICDLLRIHLEKVNASKQTKR